jgi:hypothetical protein
LKAKFAILRVFAANASLIFVKFEAFGTPAEAAENPLGSLPIRAVQRRLGRIAAPLGRRRLGAALLSTGRSP